MPGRYPSPLCPRCTVNGIGSSETLLHRYVSCPYVEETWEWIRHLLNTLDPTLTPEEDENILYFNFEKGFRENAILWTLGTYVEIVEYEVVVKENPLNLSSVIGHFKQRKHSSRYEALPELGVIEGVDFEPQGVG